MGPSVRHATQQISREQGMSGQPILRHLAAPLMPPRLSLFVALGWPEPEVQADEVQEDSQSRIEIQQVFPGLPIWCSSSCFT